MERNLNSKFFLTIYDYWIHYVLISFIPGYQSEYCKGEHSNRHLVSGKPNTSYFQIRHPAMYNVIALLTLIWDNLKTKLKTNYCGYFLKRRQYIFPWLNQCILSICYKIINNFTFQIFYGNITDGRLSLEKNL